MSSHHPADPTAMTKASPSPRRPIRFFAPGLKPYQTTEYRDQNPREFVSISLTGMRCALSCDHCQMHVLKGMEDTTRSEGVFEQCERLHRQGTRGVLISGGSDSRGRVPLLPHIEDLIRVRRELGMIIRVHPGIPDEETCQALQEVDIDGAMVDIIGDRETIRDVYHLDLEPEDYEALLERLERHRIPMVPHIILGLHYGRMRGESRALSMIARHPPKALVLVVLMPLSSTPMADVTPPDAEEIGEFFRLARTRMKETPIMLGCARPLGPLKTAIDREAIECGLDGIAYPAEGIVAYARELGRDPVFTDACCGVAW